MLASVARTVGKSLRLTEKDQCIAPMPAKLRHGRLRMVVLNTNTSSVFLIIGLDTALIATLQLAASESEAVVVSAKA
jgi:hypothetical protein